MTRHDSLLCGRSVILLFLLSVLSGVALASEELGVTKVFYGGFAFAGNAGDIEKNYPIACSLDAMAGANTHFFEPRVRDFFRKNTEAFKRVALQFGIARPEDTPLVMALALTDEKILREQLGDIHKLVVQIGLELLVLDFGAMEVVSSRPICIELIDAGKVPYPAARLTACDLNRAGVEFCARTFDAIPVVSQVDVAKIPLEGPYDLIWCGSLLTHLPEKKWAEFLQLFQRLLLPGGFVVFTTHGRHCETDLVTGKHRYGLADPQIASLLADYRRTGFGYVDYADSPGYGISLSLPSYVLAKFIQQPGWQLLTYHETAWDQRQDVVGLRKV